MKLALSRRRVAIMVTLAVVVLGSIAVLTRTVWQNHDPQAARIETVEVGRFLDALRVLADARTRDDSVRVLRERYLDRGSAALRGFTKARIGGPNELQAQIASHPNYYRDLGRTLARVDTMDASIRSAFQRFAALVPNAVFPNVALVVGRMNSGGTTTPSRILIGAEMYGFDAQSPSNELDAWERAVLRDRLLIPTIVVHELVHLNQPWRFRRNVATEAVREGSADFLAELVTGRNINAHVHSWARANEREIWERFKLEMNGKNYARWFGPQSDHWPSDVGVLDRLRVGACKIRICFGQECGHQCDPEGGHPR